MNLGIESSRECVVMKTAVGRDSGRCFCGMEMWKKICRRNRQISGLQEAVGFWVVLEVYCAQGDFQGFAVQAEGGA